MLSIKSLSVSTALSEETLAMTCKVLWEGRLIAHAKNSGTGGCTHLDYVGSKEDIQAAESWSESKPSLDDDGTQFVYDGKPSFHSLDTMVDTLVDDEQFRKAIRRSLTRQFKSKTLFLANGRLMETKGVYSPAIKDALLRKFPGATILNCLTIEKAVELYEELDKREAQAKQSASTN